MLPAHDVDHAPSLLSVGPRSLTDTEVQQWYRELHEWVARFRLDYSHFWTSGTGGGWPICWYRHRGLVEFLALTRAKESKLAKDAPHLPAHEALDWMILVQTVATAVYRVSRECREGTHREGPTAMMLKSDRLFEEWLQGRTVGDRWPVVQGGASL